MGVWTIGQAKKDFKRGLLAGAKITLRKDVGCFVELESALPDEGVGALVDARSKMPRCFVRVTSAINAVESIGFKSVQLVLSGGQ